MAVHNLKVLSCVPQILLNAGYTQKNGAGLIVFTIKTAPFVCVCPIQRKGEAKAIPLQAWTGL
jgi:hypothetical protein